MGPVFGSESRESRFIGPNPVSANHNPVGASPHRERHESQLALRASHMRIGCSRFVPEGPARASRHTKVHNRGVWLALRATRIS